MNETLEMFQLQQGALTVALRANPEPQGVLRIVKGPMEVQGDSTNLNGESESPKSEAFSQDRRSHFTNQKEGDEQNDRGNAISDRRVRTRRLSESVRNNAAGIGVEESPIGETIGRNERSHRSDGRQPRSNSGDGTRIESESVLTDRPAPSVRPALVAADEKRHRSGNGPKSFNGSGYPKFDGETYDPTYGIDWSWWISWLCNLSCWVLSSNVSG